MAAINPATQSYLDALVINRQSEYAALRTYRDYAAGEHHDYMTDDQRVLLVGENTVGDPNVAPELRINIGATVLDAETDRLEVSSIVVTAKDNEALSDQLSALAWDRWKQSRMDEGQQNVSYAACRDGNAYLMVYYDEEHERAALAFNKAYDGDTSGVDFLYQDDDPSQPICAIKVWTIQRPVIGNAKVGRIQRKNIYYDNRVEKYINRNADGTFSEAAWRPLGYGDPDWDGTLQTGTFMDAYGNSYEATFAWWTDTGTERGRPLGIPLVHFRRQARGSAYGRSALADVVPGLQDAINMTAISLLCATQLSGFKVTYATNFDSTQNSIAIYPGAIVYNTQDGAFGQLAETNLMQLIEVLNNYIKQTATLTNTPLSFFNLTGQVAAEGTQKQLESALLAKTRRNQTSFGNAYEDAIRMMLRLESVYGGEVRLTWEQIDDLDISVEWESAQVRNEREDTELAILRHEKLQTPIDVAWAEAGYSQDEIDAMKEETDVRRNAVMGALVAQIAQLGQQPPMPVVAPSPSGNGKTAVSESAAAGTEQASSGTNA